MGLDKKQKKSGKGKSKRTMKAGLAAAALFMTLLIMAMPAAIAVEISGLNIVQTGAESVKLTFSTDVDATALIKYGIGNLDEELTSSEVAAEFTRDVLGLEQGNYIFQVTATDSDGNFDTAEKTFTVGEFTSQPDSESGAGATGGTGAGAAAAKAGEKKDPSDFSPPAIIRVEVVSVTQNSAKIEMETGEEANVTIAYGTSSANFDKFKSEASFSKTHEITLDGLAENIKYYYQAAFADESWNPAKSQKNSFTPKLDREDPAVKSINLDKEMYISKTRIDIIGRTKAFSEVAMTVDGKGKRVMNSDKDGNFDFPSVPLSAKGRNTIKITITDSLGQVGSATYNIYPDIVPPKVELINMTDSVMQKSMNIKGTVTEDVDMSIVVKKASDAPPSMAARPQLVRADSNRVEFKWDSVADDDVEDYIIYRNGIPIGKVTTTSTMFVDDKASVNIPYVYQVSARDKSGNIGAKSDALELTLDKGKTLAKDWTPLDLSAQIKVEKVTRGAFEKSVTLEEGYNMITISAVDKAGNRWENSYEVLVDTIKLEIDIPEYNKKYDKAIVAHQKISGWANKPGRTIYIEVSSKEETGEEGSKEVYTAVSGSDCSADENGKKRCPWDAAITLKRVISRSKTSASDGSTSSLAEAEYKSTNQIVVYGTDPLWGKSNVVQWQWVYSMCSYGGESGWHVTIKDVFPQTIIPILFMPDKPPPYVMLTLNFKYTGQALPGKSKINNVGVTIRELGGAEKEKFSNIDLVTKGRSQCNTDSTVCYVTLNFRQNIPNISMIDEIDKIEAPIIIKYDYSEEIKGRLNTGSGATCADFQIFVDKRVKPGSVNKKFLLGIEKVFEGVVKGIDVILKPIETIRNLAFVGCVGTWIYMTFEEKLTKGSCKMGDVTSLTGTLFGDKVGEISVEELASRAIGLADIKETSETMAAGPLDAAKYQTYCGEAYETLLKSAKEGTKGASPETLTACGTCATALAKLRKSEQTMQMICDRTFCPEAPSFATHIKTYEDSVAIYEDISGRPVKNVCEAYYTETSRAAETKAAADIPFVEESRAILPGKGGLYVSDDGLGNLECVKISEIDYDCGAGGYRTYDNIKDKATGTFTK